MTTRYTPPNYEGDAFNCPYCGAYAHQVWAQRVGAVVNFGSGAGVHGMPRLGLSTCQHCKGEAIWINEQLVDPQRGSAPAPHPEMPDGVRGDYEEADAIFAKSPRGAAALLRFAIQLLCIELQEKGENLNHDIGSLVEKGLRTEVQQALDFVRVIGANAVHPLQMDLKDDHATCGALFALINVIVEDCIARPNATQALYKQLPQGALEQIEKRDQTS